MQVSCTKWWCLSLTRPTQKSLKELLSLLNFHQHAKNQFIPSNHSLDTVNFKVSWTDWPHPFLTKPIPQKFLINFWFMWICIKMQKIRLFHLFVLETWRIKKFCNMIGREHLGPCLKNKHFYEIMRGGGGGIHVFWDFQSFFKLNPLASLKGHIVIEYLWHASGIYIQRALKLLTNFHPFECSSRRNLPQKLK